MENNIFEFLKDRISRETSSVYSKDVTYEKQ
jgi:hypothetical protein